MKNKQDIRSESDLNWFVLSPHLGLIDGFYRSKEDAEGSAERAFEKCGFPFIVANVDSVFGDHFPGIPDGHFLHRMLDRSMKNDPEKWEGFKAKIADMESFTFHCKDEESRNKAADNTTRRAVDVLGDE